MPKASPFSSREQDVLYCLKQGKSNKEIALALGITIRTVEAHLGSIYHKMGVSSRAEAIVRLTADAQDDSHRINPFDQSESELLKPDTGESIAPPRKLLYISPGRRTRTSPVVRIIFLLILVFLVIAGITVAYIFLYLRQL